MFWNSNSTGKTINIKSNKDIIKLFNKEFKRWMKEEKEFLDEHPEFYKTLNGEDPTNCGVTGTVFELTNPHAGPIFSKNPEYGDGR